MTPPINGRQTANMVDITHKSNTLRLAVAQAVVSVSKKATVEAIRNGQVPKGDVFEMSRAAGLLGIKKTPELLPDCHPLPIEYAHIDYHIDGLDIYIEMTVKTIYKTGVEVEAMHGASIVALNIYDMLKPIDKGVEIRHIKLLKKLGGKSDTRQDGKSLTAAVVVCSDSVYKKEKTDEAGKAVSELLKGWDVSIESYTVVPDEKDHIQKEAENAAGKQLSMILFVGGTGLSPRDITPETLDPLLDRTIPGVEEAIRSYGQQRTPFAMLSRSKAGMIDKTLVLALPGSTKGATEGVQAIFPTVLHLFDIIKGGGH